MQFDWPIAFGETSIAILVFILHYFQEKLIKIFFKKPIYYFGYFGHAQLRTPKMIVST